MEELGIAPVGPGTPEFAALAEAGETVMWVAPTEGGIFVAPLTEGLTHAALANGAEVFGAGTAQLAIGANGIPVVFDITALSGHYLGALATAEETAAAIEAGTAAFEGWEALGALLLLF